MKFGMFFQEKQRELARRKKLLKRKVFFLKAKILLLWVLPFVIILLGVRTLRIFLRVKLRELSVQTAPSPVNTNHKPVVRPVTQTSSKPDFITPVPADGETV